jgi:hypothetical protein
MISTLAAPLAFGEGEVFEQDKTDKTSSERSLAPTEATSTYPKDLKEYREMLQNERDGLARRDRLAQEKLDEVSRESNCTTAEKIVFEEMYGAASNYSIFTPTADILNIVYEEPRFLKLLTLAASTHDATRAEVVACLKNNLSIYLTELPLTPTNSDASKSEVWVLSVQGAGAAALLLAEYDRDGSALPFVARLHARCQEASRTYSNASTDSPENVPEYIFSFDGTVFSHAEKVLLAKLKQESTRGIAYPFDAMAVLSEFEKLDSILEEAPENGDGGSSKYARELREQSELFRIATLSIVE